VTVTRLGHSVLGAPVGEQLYLRTAHYVARIDLGRGVITRSALPTIPDAEAVSFVVGAGGVLVRPSTAIRGYRIPDSGGVSRLPGLLTAPTPAWPAPREGQTWIDADGRIVLVDELGRPLRPRIPVPFGANPLGAWPDGAGGLLFQTVQGWYTAAPSGTALVTTGDMVAIGPSRLLVARCLKDGCRQVVVDRGTGRRTVLAGTYSGLTGLPGVVAPDGSVAAYADFPSSLLELTDLRTGDALLLPLRCKNAAQAMAWAPDSRELFVVDGTGGLLAVHPGTGRTVDLTALAGGPVEQVTVRAAGG
jgi:hypothetical protein